MHSFSFNNFTPFTRSILIENSNNEAECRYPSDVDATGKHVYKKARRNQTIELFIMDYFVYLTKTNFLVSEKLSVVNR